MQIVGPSTLHGGEIITFCPPGGRSSPGYRWTAQPKLIDLGGPAAGVAKQIEQIDLCGSDVKGDARCAQQLQAQLGSEAGQQEGSAEDSDLAFAQQLQAQAGHEAEAQWGGQAFLINLENTKY